jgi:hypothetical protein
MKTGDIVKILNFKAQVRNGKKDLSGSHGLLRGNPELFGFVHRCYVYVPKLQNSFWIDMDDLQLIEVRSGRYARTPTTAEDGIRDYDRAMIVNRRPDW